MTQSNVVNIHGKDYITVAGRVQMAHEANEKVLSITTELVSSEPVLVKATVVTPKGTYTGYSASYGDPKKPIEKQSPYEVAETSAVGRALGFAGYGAIESIASADEMKKAGAEKLAAPSAEPSSEPSFPSDEEEAKVCSAHDEPAAMYRGVSKSKVDAEGNPKVYWWHKNELGQMCFGSGYKD